MKGDFSRAEPQSAPQNATSVIGDPLEQETKRKGNGNTGCTRATGRELVGKSASTKQLMAMANINKQHFLLAGSCAVVLSVISRSSLGGRRQGIRGVKEIGILIKVLFREKASEYHSGAINKEKHLQGRCCDQWAQKCLGSRDLLNHASGTSGL